MNLCCLIPDVMTDAFDLKVDEVLFLISHDLSLSCWATNGGMLLITLPHSSQVCRDHSRICVVIQSRRNLLLLKSNILPIIDSHVP
jgi:hypothetical protein